MGLSDEIREFVNKSYIEPARKTGEEEVRIRAGTVHDEMGLSSRQPAVCGALGAKKFEEEYDVKMIDEEWGENVNQPHARNIWYTFRVL